MTVYCKTIQIKPQVRFTAFSIFIFLVMTLFGQQQINGQTLPEIRKDISQHKVFTSIDEALINPLEVYRLKLNDGDFNEDKLKGAFKKLTNLRELQLQKSFITKIPSSIGALKKLQILDLQHLEEQNYNLKTLPKSIQNLKEIVFINLIGNPNLNWNKAFLHLSKMPKLINVAIMNNNFKSLPDNIKKLTSLEMIWLGKNPNLDLKDTFLKLSNLKRLSQLGIGGSDYTELPQEVSSLKSIKNLWLSGNNWKNLNGLESLENLNNVSLHNCNLTTLPKAILECKSLISLSLVGNKNLNFNDVLDKLPETVKTLNLSGNDIKTLSANSIKNLKLDTLILRKNLISEDEISRYKKQNSKIKIVH